MSCAITFIKDWALAPSGQVFLKAIQVTSPNQKCILWASAFELPNSAATKSLFHNMVSKDRDRHDCWDIISGSQSILYGSACRVELQNNLWCLWWRGLEVTACKPELSPSRIVNYSKARSLLLDQDGADHCDDHCGEDQCTYTQDLLPLQSSS